MHGDLLKLAKNSIVHIKSCLCNLSALVHGVSPPILDSFGHDDKSGLVLFSHQSNCAGRTLGVL